MSETKHPWCSDVSRDEAIRAAEDAAAAERTPLPDHRDLPAAVAELRERVERLEQCATAGLLDRLGDSLPADVTTPREAAPGSREGVSADGLRTERVTLEITHGSVVGAAGWSWGTIIRVKPGESVRVVEESVEVAYGQASIDRLTAERDAALRHIAATEQSRRDAINDLDAALEHCKKIEARLAKLVGQRDAAIRERDEAREEAEKATSLAKGLEDKRAYFRRQRDVAVQECERLRARVAELESAPAANAGGERQEPVAWVATKPGDDGGYQRCLGWDRHKVILGIDLDASSHPVSVSPLYAAPQPPRGWLTEDDCAALYLARAVLDGVFVGSWQEKHDAARRLVSIRERARREAGGEVGE